MSQSTLTVSERPAQPFYPNRVVNFLGRFKKPIVSEPEQLMRAASATTGLNDFGSQDFLPGLQVFCRAMNSDTQMHYLGRLASRRLNTKLLIDRLQIQATLKKDLDVLRQKIRSPILICGDPRSGTTLLQRLMAQDSQFRVMLAWEAYFGTQSPHPDTYEENSQIRQAEEFLAIVDKTSPVLFITHPMGAKLPEECWMLLERQFIRPLYGQFWEIPQYWEWLMDRSEDDLANDILYYKKQLQMLQRYFKNPQWLLKSPLHGLFLVPFSRVFPDIRFVQCHRDPVRVVPSACSLVAARKAAYYPHIDFKAVGRKAMTYFENYYNRILKARGQLGASRFSDVSFTRLTVDPLGTVEELYGSLGLTLTPEVKEKMATFLESQRGGQHTLHKYTLEEFGLGRATVESRFERYRTQFQEFF